MLSAFEEIDGWLRRAWRREGARRFVLCFSWAGASLLFFVTMGVHVCLRLGFWVPTPAQLLQGVLACFALAFCWTFWRLRTMQFSNYLRDAEITLGEQGLTTWQSLRRRKSFSPLETLFLDRLHRQMRTQPLGYAEPISIPKIPKLAFAASALGILFLLLPWGGGMGLGMAPKPSSQATSQATNREEKEKETAKAGGASSSESAADPAPAPKSSGLPREREKKSRPVEPKYVPAREGEGPRVRKETLLFESPAPGGEDGLGAVAAAKPPSENYAAWRKIAEESIRKEQFAPQDARLITRYFDKIRPQ